MATDGDRTRPQYRLAIVYVLTNPTPEYIDPTSYLKASGEILALIFVLSWGTSLIAAPDMIAANPLYDHLGYYSLCVGFDSYPANHIAAAIYVFAAYLGIRFLWTDTQRAVLSKGSLTKGQYYFTHFSNGLYLLSLCAFALVFLESPFVSIYSHAFFFVQLIGCRFLVVAANFYEAPVISASSKVFLAVYGIISLTLPPLIMLSLFYYDQTGEVMVPWQITAAFDYGWFVCLALATQFLPDAPRIRATWSLEGS